MIQKVPAGDPPPKLSETPVGQQKSDRIVRIGTALVGSFLVVIVNDLGPAADPLAGEIERDVIALEVPTRGRRRVHQGTTRGPDERAGVMVDRRPPPAPASLAREKKRSPPTRARRTATRASPKPSVERISVATKITVTTCALAASNHVTP